MYVNNFKNKLFYFLNKEAKERECVVQNGEIGMSNVKKVVTLRPMQSHTSVYVWYFTVCI